MAINSSNIFVMATPNTETTSALLGQLSQILGVPTRDDGRLYLSDMCQSLSVNRYARYKSEDYNTSSNLTEAERRTNLFGFNLYTPNISILDREIPHATYIYRQPTGGASSMNRIRDFNGYNHYAGSPLNVDWPLNGKIMRDQANGITIKFNFQVDGWDSTSCVKMGEIMDSTSQSYYVALLLNNGSSSYLLPTDVLVSTIRDNTYVMPTVLFAKNASLLTGYENTTNVYPFVISDMASDTSSTQYTIAVVASPVSYPSDKLPVNATSVKSMEVKYGIDRKTLGVVTSDSLAGLSGSLNTTWNKTAGSPQNSFTPYYLDGTTLRVRLSTTSAWTRTNAYIEAEISSDYGWITEDGSSTRVNVLVVGEYATIGASNGGANFDIADLSNYVIWAVTNASPKTVTVRLTAYTNSNKSGESKLLGITKVTL